MLFALIGYMMGKITKTLFISICYFVFACALPAAVPVTSSAQIDYGENPPETTRRELHLESITIDGNHRIPDSFILDHLALAQGERIDVDTLERARGRLEATGQFRRVDLASRPGSRRGAVIVIISVEERSPLSFETGFGYDDLNGWFLTLLGMRLNNTLGAGTHVNVGLRLGFRIAGIDAAWEKPAPSRGGFGYGLRFHVYNQSHLFFGAGPDSPQGWNGGGWLGFQQDIKRAGAEALLRYRLGDNTRISFGLQVESFEPDSTFQEREEKRDYTAADLPPVLRGQLDETVKTGFLFRALRDTRDHAAYPHRGTFALATFETNNSFLGGDEIYTKSTFELRGHIPLAARTILSSRAKGGMISRSAPYYERFYLGGNYSLRGFEEWSLSPTAGDDGFWLINVELRTPLIESPQRVPHLTGLLFFDAGQGWQRGRAFSTHGIESAFGYGLRLRLPWLGTLGIDAGIPLSRGKTDENFRVHGLLGFSF